MGELALIPLTWKLVLIMVSSMASLSLALLTWIGRQVWVVSKVQAQHNLSLSFISSAQETIQVDQKDLLIAAGKFVTHSELEKRIEALKEKLRLTAEWHHELDKRITLLEEVKKRACKDGCI